MTIGALLLHRRRWDPLALAIGMACLSLLISVGKVVFLFLRRLRPLSRPRPPRSWRGMPIAFTGMLAAWAVWQIGLSLARGEPLDGNRVLSYAGLEFACALLPLGLGLVRHPAHALAWGARIGVIALVILAPIDYAMTGARVGLGKNEAIFAFVVGACAIAARLPTGNRLRFLPDGRVWTYLATVPIVLSGTRAAMFLFVVVAVLDLRRAMPRLRASGRRGALALVAVVAAAMLAVVPVGGFLLDRVESGVTEIEAYEATGLAVGSVDTRMAMWSSAVRVLAQNPLIGVGGTARMERVAAEAGPNAREILRYQHLHNVVLDEALSSGLVGVALMVGAMAAFLAGALRRAATRWSATPASRSSPSRHLRPFPRRALNEWMVLIVFASMAVILTELRRARPFGAARARVA